MHGGGGAGGGHHGGGFGGHHQHGGGQGGFTGPGGRRSPGPRTPVALVVLGCVLVAMLIILSGALH